MFLCSLSPLPHPHTLPCSWFPILTHPETGRLNSFPFPIPDSFGTVGVCFSPFSPPTFHCPRVDLHACQLHHLIHPYPSPSPLLFIKLHTCTCLYILLPLAFPHTPTQGDGTGRDMGGGIPSPGTLPAFCGCACVSASSPSLPSHRLYPSHSHRFLLFGLTSFPFPPSKICTFTYTLLLVIFHFYFCLFVFVSFCIFFWILVVDSSHAPMPVLLLVRIFLHSQGYG